MSGQTYRTSDISIAAYLYAQGARVRSVQGRMFFLDVPSHLDAVDTALSFIGSPEAEYDQTVRVLKKVILEWNRYGLVGRNGRWSIDGRMEIIAYLCVSGARLVGFERVSQRGRNYRMHFDADTEPCEKIVDTWPESAAKRFDDAVRDIKRMSRS